ncbi:MAG: RrF2 family transcriptional regulator [Sporichthyaceae bacterium]
MRISAKVDYAVRALIEIAGAPSGVPRSAEAISTAQDIPRDFLLSVLADLRRAGILASQRGQAGGWMLVPPPSEVSVADVIRAVDGPLVSVHGRAPEDVAYTGSAEALQQVWIAVRVGLRQVLEEVTVAHLMDKSLPDSASELTQSSDAWRRR